MCCASDKKSHTYNYTHTRTALNQRDVITLAILKDPIADHEIYTRKSFPSLPNVTITKSNPTLCHYSPPQFVFAT